MRIAPTILALLATGFLAACNSEETCTSELAQKKAADLSAKMTEIATTDPAKLAAMGPKVQELAAKAAGTGDDVQATCKAIDDMMAELSK
jgi:predicted small secreted protein